MKKFFISSVLFVLTTSCTSPEEKPKIDWAPVEGNVFLDHNGDTLNRTDKQNRKQGKWVIFKEAHQKSITDVSAMQEDGFYKDDKKEGYWRIYSQYGELLDSVLYINGIQQIEGKKTYTVN
jgi:hypothetical protein